MNIEIRCLECGWVGVVEDCLGEKQWSEHAGGSYIAVPSCPECYSFNLLGVSQ